MVLTQVQQLSKKEIEDLLRKGAYGALMDEEDEGSKFCEEDIDQILQRRTHTITIESEGKGSTFAKVPRRNNTTLYSTTPHLDVLCFKDEVPTSMFLPAGQFCCNWQPNRHFPGGPRLLAEMGQKGRIGPGRHQWTGE